MLAGFRISLLPIVLGIIAYFAAPARAQFTYLSQANANGQLSSPYQLAFTSTGNILAAAQNSHCIVVMDSSGNFLSRIGELGAGSGQFISPRGVAVSPTGLIAVGDTNNHRVQIFDGNGAYLRQFGSAGNGIGEFNGPECVVFDNAGNLYVGDPVLNRIQVFDVFGNYQRQITGIFNLLRNFCLDGAGHLYITDQYNSRIQVFTTSGAFVRQFDVYRFEAPIQVYPTSVALDGAGHVLVTIGRSGVQVYDLDGTYLTDISTGLGAGPGEFADPFFIALQSPGRLAISDTTNQRIQLFSAPTAAAGAPEPLPLVLVAIGMMTRFLRGSRGIIRVRP